MTESFFKITTDLAGQIKLVVADVDGTLLSSGDSVSPIVAEIIRSLEHCGIIFIKYDWAYGMWKIKLHQGYFKATRFQNLGNRSRSYAFA